MVNEQEETATSSNVSASDGSKNDEKYSNNRMIISEKEITPNKNSSSFSCSMGLESNLKALGISPHEENNSTQTNPYDESSHYKESGIATRNSNATSFSSSEITRKEINMKNDSIVTMSTVNETQAVPKKRGRGRPRKQEKDLSYLKEEESSRSSLNSLNSLEKEPMTDSVENDSLTATNFSHLTVSRREHDLSSTARNTSHFEYSNSMAHFRNADGYTNNSEDQTNILSRNSENLDIPYRSNVCDVEISSSKNRSSHRIREREKFNRTDDNERKKTDTSNMHTRNGKMLNKNTADRSKIPFTQQNGHNDENFCSTTPKIANGLSMEMLNNIHSHSEHVAKPDEDSSSHDSKEISDTSHEGSVRGESESNSAFPLKVKSRWHNASQIDGETVGNIKNTNDTESGDNILTSSSQIRDEFHADAQVVDSVAPTKLKRESRTRNERRMSKRTSPTQKDVRPQNNDVCNDTSSMAVNDNSNNEIVTPAQQLEIEQRLKSFEHISTNSFVCQRRRNKQTRDMECDCSLSKDDTASGKKGCGDDCLNRLLMVECNKSCSLGDNCGNKRFQKLENAPTEVFKTEYKGVGLRASSLIGRDSFIMEYVGEVLDPQRFHKRAKKYSQNDVKHFYFMALSTDYIIDATSKGNISRFINHSCDPNAETQKWTVDGELRVGFFSKRKIKPGEEITFDYKYERYGQNAQKCFCGATNCRGWLGGEPEKDDPESSDEETIEQDESSLSSEGPDETEQVKSYEKLECDTSSPIEDPGFSPSWSQKISPPKQRKYNRRRLRRTPRKIKNFETDEFEEDIERLNMTGIRTKSHTVDLCRLMVRVTETKTRLTLCHLLLDADSPCRRLFLDYHGLKILNSWMGDLKWDSLIDLEVKIVLEDVLSILNIPHKTMLVESNIWHAVTSWATYDISNKNPSNFSNLNEATLCDTSNSVTTSNPLIPSSHSPSKAEMEIDSTTSKINDQNCSISLDNSSSISDEALILQKLKSINQKLSENNTEGNENIDESNNFDSTNIISNSHLNHEETASCNVSESRPMDTDDKTKSNNIIPSLQNEIASKALLVQEKAQLLLNDWVNLKEVFKIPRKELVKLRAEHEKELDEAEKHLKTNQTHHGDDTKHAGGFNNFHQQRFALGNTGSNRFGYERNRPSFRPHSPPPLPKHRETRCSRFDDKTGRLNSGGLSRDHRRFYISQKYEMEKEEKRKRDLLQAWHENKCYYLRLDPTITPMFPEIPEFYFDPTVGTWYQMPELPPQVDVWGKLGFPHMALLPKEAYRETDSPLPDPTLIYPPGVVKVSYLYGQPMSLDPSYSNAQIDIPEPEPIMLPQESHLRIENSSLSPFSPQNIPLSYIDPDTGQEVPIPEERHRSNEHFTHNTVIQTIATSISSESEFNRDLMSPAAPNVSEQTNIFHPHHSTESNSITMSTPSTYRRGRSASVSPTVLPTKLSNTDSCSKSEHEQVRSSRKTFNVMVKLPSSWRVTRDPSGKVYYYNIRTKDVQWVPPQGTETIEENSTGQNLIKSESQTSHQIDVLGATPESDDDMDDVSKTESPMDEDGDESDIDEDDDTDLNLDMDLDAKSLDNPQGPYSDLSAQERNILLRFSKLSKEERQNERRQKRERDREKKEYERKRRRERHGKHRKDGLVTEHLIPKRGEREKTDLMTFQEMRERLANRDAIREKQEIEEREEAERDREEEKQRLRQLEKEKREQQAVEKQTVVEKKAAQHLAVSTKDQSSPSNLKVASPEANLSREQVVQKSDERFTSSCEQTSKTTTAAADTSSEVSKKIRENFMKEASKIIVKALDPFRKSDSQKAKIKSTEDFKHLAKKLTEYILLKEMKHCPRIEDLRFTESTKKKAAEFVKKYMLKFGDTYKRSPQKS